MIDCIQVNLYIIMIKTSCFNFSFSGTVTTFYMYHCVMSCSRQTDLAAGSSAADRGQAEAKCLRPKFRGRDQNFGLEATLASRT